MSDKQGTSERNAGAGGFVAPGEGPAHGRQQRERQTPEDKHCGCCRVQRLAWVWDGQLDKVREVVNKEY
ncbi:hypothetical protein [Phaffia rhodozyma]|uniref:Uncharacterized protein n=1 Tax=Phaffia rhodozyma TaxID=264483 RepID=A0A0F7SYD7_PHARH|nr:hypothetical protein [Phaffia rhodozyma]